MKELYIVLSRSQTIFAKAIRLVTRKHYNHTSIAFDESLDTFYSFGRINPRLMFPAGFITEGVHNGFFKIHPDCEICVLKTAVSDEDMRLIQDRLNVFIADARKYKYDVFHIPHMMLERAYTPKNNYVCSVFVASLLKDIFDFGKDYSLVYPEDFYRLKYDKIYEGTAGDYNYEKQSI